jgi:NADH dehydrogenase
MAEDGERRRPHVVVLGGGFGGLETAVALRRADVDVTLIDKRNHHLFQPLLYQVATAALTPTDIAAPIRKVLADQDNAEVLLARAERLDPERKIVSCVGGKEVPYDFLVIAAGMTNAYFGHDAWEKHAPGLKSLEEALHIRDHVLLAYETAEDPGTSEAERKKLLTFVVIGGGPTGVELAGALAEIAKRTMTRNFRHFDPKSARVILVEGSDRLLASYPIELSEQAREDLEELGCEVRLGVRAKAIDENGLELEGERIHARTVLWAAGVRGVPIAGTLGVKLDRSGRIPVNPDLTVTDKPGVFAIGDIAAFKDGDSMLPGVAQVAMQQGRCAAKNILHSIEGEPLETFRYKDLGSMATIGRKRAIAVLGRMHLTGFLAWLAWLFVHLMALVGYRNRAAVLADWAWAYFTYQRSARIILDRAAPRG